MTVSAAVGVFADAETQRPRPAAAGVFREWPGVQESVTSTLAQYGVFCVGGLKSKRESVESRWSRLSVFFPATFGFEMMNFLVVVGRFSFVFVRCTRLI